MYFLPRKAAFLSSFLGPVVLLLGISSQHTSSCAPLGQYPHIYDSPPSLKAYEVYVAFFFSLSLLFFSIMLFRYVESFVIYPFVISLLSTNPLGFPLHTLHTHTHPFFNLSSHQSANYCLTG